MTQPDILRNTDSKRQPKVSIEPCGQMFRHSKGAWSIVLPLDRLPSWTDVYRRLRDRNGGKYRQHYDADVESLESLARDQISKQKNGAEE